LRNQRKTRPHPHSVTFSRPYYVYPKIVVADDRLGIVRCAPFSKGGPPCV